MRSSTKVSIIVVVKNEERYISECLASLVDQDYPPHLYEVLVVDGISSDGTRQIVSSFCKTQKNFCLVDNPRGSYSAGLNIGIRAAQGDVVTKVDGHSIVAPNFISKGVEYLHKTEAACVGGPVETLGDGYLGEAIACVLSSPFGVGNARFRWSKNEGFVDTVPYGAYWKWVFDQVGLFDESRARTEDLDLHHRIRQKGGKFFLTPEIRAYYRSRSTIGGMVQQAFHNGYEVISALYAASWRHLVPLAFASAITAGLAASVVSPVAQKLVAGMLILYLMCALLSSVSVGVKRGFKYIPVLPFLYAFWHVSYGLGSFAGILRAGRRFLLRATQG